MGDYGSDFTKALQTQLRQLIHYAKGADPELQREVAEKLANEAVKPDRQEQIVELGGLELLLPLVESSDKEVQRLAAHALANLSVNADNQIIFSLFNAYPNPFNPKLSIDIIIPETGFMNVSAYNLNGQHMETLYNGFASSNTLYNLVWDASKLSSGLYIIKVESVDFKYSRVVSLLK